MQHKNIKQMPDDDDEEEVDPNTDALAGRELQRDVYLMCRCKDSHNVYVPLPLR